MEPDQTFEESVREVMQTLPPLIQRYIFEERYRPAVSHLMQKYELRVDQAGAFDQSLLLLLMGVTNPTEFANSLSADVGIDPQSVPHVVNDVNELIFIPLREEMERQQRGGAPTSKGPLEQPAVDTAPQEPAPAPVVARSVAPPPPPPEPSSISTYPTSPQQHVSAPSYIPEFAPGYFAPPPQSPRYQNQESANLNSYLRAVPAPAKPPRELINKMAPRTSAAAPLPNANIAAPAPRQPLDTGHLLEDHEEPSVVFHTSEAVSPASAASSMPQLPGSLPSVTVPEAPTVSLRPKPPVVPSPSLNVLPPPPAPRLYASDPYREPIETGA